MRFTIQLIFFLAVFSTHLNAQDALAYYKQSQEQMLSGKYLEAMGSINQAINVDSSKADYFLQKATLYYHLKEYKDALRQCYAAHKIEPDKPQVHYLRGLLSLSTDNYGGAIFFLGKVISLSPDKDYTYRAYIGRGKAYLRTSKLNEAITDFASASSLKPDSIEPQLLMATAYIKAEVHDKALPIIEKIIQSNPNIAVSYKLLGSIYKDKKAFAKAESAYNTYCGQVANDAEAFQEMAYLYLENKEYDKARVSIEKAIALYPSEPLNFKILAIICMEKGQNEEGCNNMFKAFQLGYLEKYGYDALDIYLGKCEGK